MNVFYRAYARVFQGIFWVACHFLDFSEPKIIKGEGCLKELPKHLKEKNIESVLIVTDNVLFELGMLNDLFKALDKEGVKYSCYHKTVPNPTIDNIEEALEQYHKEGHKAIIAFGGGSSMDCAKGVGARVARPKTEVQKMRGVLKVLKKIPPFYAVPTTSGTGSETTLAAVITNAKTHEKYAINDPVLIPDYAVLDPVVTVKLPPHITSTTGMDALTHAVEAFIGSANTIKTKKMAISATKLIFKYLEKAYNNPTDIEARNEMQIAAYQAGVAFTRAYVGNVHAIAHSFGGYYHVPHGLANAVILPHVLRRYGKASYKKLAILAREVGMTGNSDKELANMFIDEIFAMNKRMNIPMYLEPYKAEDIDQMIKNAMKEANPLYPVPVIFNKEEFKEMYDIVCGLKK